MRLMPRQPAGFGKAQQERLRELIRVQIRQLLQFGSARDHGPRRDDPADAHARKRDLRKTAQQNHVRIELLQPRAGSRRDVGQFAVDVVLDHCRARRTRHARRMLVAIRRRHRRARRILKRRRDHEHLRARVERALQRVEIDAICRRPQCRSVRAPASRNRFFRPGIDRFFERDFFARAHQRAAQQIERLLAAVGDEDVVGVARDSALNGPIEQITPQRFVAAGRAELQQRFQVAGSPELRGSIRGTLDRKQLFRRPELVKLITPLAALPAGVESGAVRARDQFSVSAAPLRTSAHITAAADFAFDQPVGFQQFVGGRDGGPVQSKLASQFASRRQPVARSASSPVSIRRCRYEPNWR